MKQDAETESESDDMNDRDSNHKQSIKYRTPNKLGAKHESESEEEIADEANLDDAIDRLKHERAKHLKSKFIQTIKERYMRDSSFGLQQYKKKLRYIKDNEALLRSTDGIK